MAFVFGQYTPTFVAPSCIYLGSGFFFFLVCVCFFFLFLKFIGMVGLAFLSFSDVKDNSIFFLKKKKKRTTLFLFSLSYYWVLRFVP